MEIDFRFVNVAYSEDLVNYAEESLQKLERFGNQRLEARLFFLKNRSEMIVRAQVHGYRRTFVAEAEAEIFYASVDDVVAKLARQLERVKTKSSRRNGRSAREFKKAS